jgi:2-keto-3-deoxy-L-rhamnonate aldolase RhmA
MPLAEPAYHSPGQDAFMNNVEKIREKWARGQLCVGTNVTFTDSTVIELFGEAGFDIVWIDMEHSSMSVDHALNHVRTCRGVGLAPFIRVPSLDPVVIKPFLELHPAAIIVPRISSVADAEAAVKSCRYPPRGVRGFGPIRGVRFGDRSLDDYLANVDREVMVILQIEHIDAVNEIEAILDVPGVDSIVPGPMDLAGSMGLLGQTGHPDVAEALDRLIDAARKKNVPMGQSIGFNPEVVQRAIEKGVSWICADGDWHMLFPQAKRVCDQIRSLSQ